MIKTIDTNEITEKMFQAFRDNYVDATRCIFAVLAAAPAVEPAQAVPVGYCLMPREPTQWMREQIACGIESNSVADVWGRLIRAVDIENKHRAKEPAQAVPVAWKHDCAALLTNNVELWIDACPHCGKPRTVPPAISEPAQAVPVGYRLQSIAEFDAMNEWIMSGKHDQKAIDHDKKQKALHFVRWIASLKTGGLIQARANDLLSMLEAGDEN